MNDYGKQSATPKQPTERPKGKAPLAVGSKSATNLNIDFVKSDDNKIEKYTMLHCRVIKGYPQYIESTKEDCIKLLEGALEYIKNDKAEKITLLRIEDTNDKSVFLDNSIKKNN